LADEESTPRKAKAGGAAVAVGTGKNFVNVRPRDDDDMEEEEEEEEEVEEETHTQPAKRTYTPQLSSKPHAAYPPMHLVTLPQASLQISASAAGAGALTTISTDDGSTIVVDEMGIDLPDDEDDEDFLDDNRDLPGDF
jgi:hypothetical protein